MKVPAVSPVRVRRVKVLASRANKGSNRGSRGNKVDNRGSSPRPAARLVWRHPVAKRDRVAVTTPTAMMLGNSVLS